MDLRLKHLFTCILGGPTGSGKAVFVKRFFQFAPDMFDVSFKNKLFWYGEWQKSYEKMQIMGIKFLEGLPDISTFDGKEPTLLVLDDLMSEADERVRSLVTKGSHQRNLSVIFITQNIFHQSKQSCDISLNAQYMDCMKSARDKAQIFHLARQLFPENRKYVVQSFADASSVPYGYHILIDLKQTTPENLRLRSRIFPDDCGFVAYEPKS